MEIYNRDEPLNPNCWNVCPSIRPSAVSIRILFQDDNLSKHQWIFTKLRMCIDIVEVWFGLMGKSRHILTELSVRDTPIFWFQDVNLCKCQGIANEQSFVNVWQSYLPATW